MEATDGCWVESSEAAGQGQQLVLRSRGEQATDRPYVCVPETGMGAWPWSMALVAYLLSHAGVVLSSAWCVRGGDMILGAPIEVQSAVPVPPPSPAKIGWTGKRHAGRGAVRSLSFQKSRKPPPPIRWL